MATSNNSRFYAQTLLHLKVIRSLKKLNIGLIFANSEMFTTEGRSVEIHFNHVSSSAARRPHLLF